MVIVLTQLVRRSYTTHMNPSRSPLQKYHLASCFCEKVKRLRGFFVLVRDKGPGRAAGVRRDFSENKGLSGLR